MFRPRPASGSACSPRFWAFSARWCCSKGGDLVTGVTADGRWQVVLIVLVGLVFAAAVLAVIAGGVATWGGLKDIKPISTGPPADADKRAHDEKGFRGGWTQG